MDRNLASVLVLASTAVLAVVLAATGSGNAYADDITVDTTPFTSTKTRAEVQSELFSQAAQARSGAREWAMQSNHQLAPKSDWSRQQAQAEYKASRAYVSAVSGEDSGSAYFIKSASARGASAAATTMGGPAR